MLELGLEELFRPEHLKAFRERWATDAEMQEMTRGTSFEFSPIRMREKLRSLSSCFCWWAKNPILTPGWSLSR